jgi:hypothetical protein
MNGALRFYNETSIYLVHWIPFAPRLRSSLDAIAWGPESKDRPARHCCKRSHSEGMS